MRTRRHLTRLLLDGPDWIVRVLTGRRRLPPRSLRGWVGTPAEFERVGRWFAQELLITGLLDPYTRVLDVGCGCGRLALALLRDPEIVALDLRYRGLDVDRASIAWCRRHIERRHRRFTFEHADLRHPLYNPAGALRLLDWRFPHDDGSFDLVVAASLFTHLLVEETAHELGEMARLLAPGGRIYATFFLHDTPPEAPADRRTLDFPVARGPLALHSEAEPEAAVSYSEPFLRETISASGLSLAGPVSYGEQDHLVLHRRVE